MEDEQDIDAAFSLFDPAFTFSDLLADGDDKSAFANELMPVDPAQTSVSATSGIALDLSGPGQYDIVSVSDEREERQLQQEAQHGRGKCPDVPAYKQRARATQARFRLRQKERQRDAEQQARELTRQLHQMTLDKAYLEYRTRRLERALKHNDAHLLNLSSHKNVRQIEQELCLESLARFVNTVDGHSTDQASLDGIKQWRMQDLEAFHLRYIGRLQRLVTLHSQEPDKHGDELEDLIRARRLHLSKDPYYSSLYWAVLCWNRHRQNQLGSQPPGRHQWAQLLTKLQLSSDQQQHLLTAREQLLSVLDVIGSERRDIIFQLGQVALELGKEHLAESPAAKDLQDVLERERTACSDFVFSITDDILTPWQEAICEVSSYPWHIDFLEMSHVLAGRHGTLPDLPAGVKQLQLRPPGLNSMMPLQSAYELLCMPITCYGLGIHLKQCVTLCPFQTVNLSKCYHLLDFGILQRMTLAHAHFGRFEDTVFSVCACER